MATTMMSSMLKEKENRITVQIKGDGPLKSIVVCGNSSLNMKAYVSNPNVELPLNKNGKLDVSKAIGKGYINVVKDIGLKEPYIGFSQLVSGEIAEDFAYLHFVNYKVYRKSPYMYSSSLRLSCPNQDSLCQANH